MTSQTTAPALPAAGADQRAVRPWEGLLIGLVCGGIVWAVASALHPIFQVPEQFHIAGLGAPVERHVAFRREQDRVDRWHAMLYLADLGLLTGGALGFRAARRGEKRWSMALVGLLGAMGGAMGGVLAPLMYVYVRDKIGHADLLQIVVAQLLVGVPLGLAVGLGLGLAGRSSPRVAKGLLAGAAAGGLFAILYPLAVAVLLPAANTEVLLPEEALTRLVWLAMLGSCVGLVVSTATGCRVQSLREPTIDETRLVTD